MMGTVMKVGAGVLVALAVLFVVRLRGLGRKSAAMTPVLGASGGALRPCESALNCVSSSLDKSPWYYPPLRRTGTSAEFLDAAAAALTKLGGVVRTRTAVYLHAEFRSTLFGFVDDVELLAPPERDHAQVRSASRVGKSDLGVNRKRLDRLKAELGQ